MTILHLNTHHAGGSFTYATQLSAELVNLGIDSRVLCKGGERTGGTRTLLNRLVRRISVRLSREPWHGTWRFLPPPDGAQLRGVQVLHLHNVDEWFDVPKWLVRLPANIRVIATLHDLWHVSGGCFLYRGCTRFTDRCSPCPILKRPIDRWAARVELARKVDAYRKRPVQLVANSQWLAHLVESSVMARACGGLRVIPPAIDTGLFRPVDRTACRGAWDLPADASIIVTGCASLTDRNKNVPWLLERLAALPQQDRMLVVAFGEGQVPVPPGLRVRFTGAIPDRADLARVLGAADLFVSASRMETYGLTLVEALACGVPVVAFRVGAIPESAPDGQGALLCDSDDADQFCQAVLRLMQDAPLRQQMGQSGRRLVEHRNSLKIQAEAYESVYDNKT